ncbi:hypothetical protein ACN47E_005753 [Coniothyrium glycines]
MDALEFICDRRFHRSFTLPPNPDIGRETSYRVSYSDFGDSQSNAVVLLCGALMGMRLSYSPLDQLAKAYNVRIIHPDRPGIGGSDSVELEKRVEIWLELVPQLLAHLDIPYVSLASHSGGDVYLLNTLLAYPQLLHPQTPYVCFFAPWVHPTHSKVAHMWATSMLPAPMIGKFASLVKFVNENVVPLSGMSDGVVQGIKDVLLHSTSGPAPVALTPHTTRSRETSLASRRDLYNLPLDDPDIVEDLRQHITTFLFAESIDGISADAQLFMRKPSSLSWCSPSLLWSDIDFAASLLSTMIESDSRLDGHSRTWVIDAFHAESDDMVGEKGKQWFDDCWMSNRASESGVESSIAGPSEPSAHAPYFYRSSTVEDGDHNFLMDPAFGASEIWLQRVREAVPESGEIRSPPRYPHKSMAIY